MKKISIVESVFIGGVMLMAFGMLGAMSLQPKDSNPTGVLGVTSGSLTVSEFALSPKSGTVTSSPAGINCGPDCSESGLNNNTFTLTATPNSDKVFSNWTLKIGTSYGSTTGTCNEGNNTSRTCTVTVPQYGADVTPTYFHKTGNVTVTKTGTGSGTVTAPGMDCGNDCTAQWTHGSGTTLTATASPGSVFSGWQPGATNCQTITGKGTQSANLNSTCNFNEVGFEPNRTAIAKFDSDGSAPSQKNTNASNQSSNQQPTTVNTPNVVNNDTTRDELINDNPQRFKVDLVNEDGEKLVPLDGEDKLSFQNKEPIILSGNTVPNGVVKLYIFSEPQQAEVVADDNGAWSYTITSIEPGDHRVEMEVVDPANGETSQRAEVLSFIVAQAEDTEAITETPNEPTLDDEKGSILPIILGLSVLLMVIVAGFVYLRVIKKRSD